MKSQTIKPSRNVFAAWAAVALSAVGMTVSCSSAWAAEHPTPLVKKGLPADWVFMFKLNSGKFPIPDGTKRPCIFGGEPNQGKDVGQSYVWASSDSPVLQQGTGLLGTSLDDPLGATFAEVVRSRWYYVVWNDQFYASPNIQGCGKACNAPWGHSKGMLAWDSSGRGIVLQVTTPSWPASGSNQHPREGDGNTLGCESDNNIKFSQHFFALKLSKDDVVNVLDTLNNASVATDVANPQLVHSGGPLDIKDRVATLGQVSQSDKPTNVVLSSGVRLLSKPSNLQVPPWEMVSAELDGTDLYVASWWSSGHGISPTDRSTPIGCWNPSLGTPGSVDIALQGEWNGVPIGLKASAADGNHAKIAVPQEQPRHFAIFGDMNEEGTLSGTCSLYQNGRGGLFFVVSNDQLAESVGALIGASKFDAQGVAPMAAGLLPGAAPRRHHGRAIVRVDDQALGQPRSGARSGHAPGDFDYYLLTLSWSPSWAEQKCNKSGDPRSQCNNPFGFVVHGMWPQFLDGSWPVQCAGADAFSADESAGASGAMPDDLMEHEWNTHGTCSGLPIARYFADVAQTFGFLRIPDDLRLPDAEQSMTADALRVQLEQANSGRLPPHSVFVTCSGVAGRKVLEDVRVCLDKEDLSPMRCPVHDANCGDGPITIPPVRH